MSSSSLAISAPSFISCEVRFRMHASTSLQTRREVSGETCTIMCRAAWAFTTWRAKILVELQAEDAWNLNRALVASKAALTTEPEKASCFSILAKFWFLDFFYWTNHYFPYFVYFPLLTSDKIFTRARALQSRPRAFNLFVDYRA